MLAVEGYGVKATEDEYRAGAASLVEFQGDGARSDQVSQSARSASLATSLVRIDRQVHRGLWTSSRRSGLLRDEVPEYPDALLTALVVVLAEATDPSSPLEVLVGGGVVRIEGTPALSEGGSIACTSPEDLEHATGLSGFLIDGDEMAPPLLESELTGPDHRGPSRCTGGLHCGPVVAMRDRSWAQAVLGHGGPDALLLVALRRRGPLWYGAVTNVTGRQVRPTILGELLDRRLVDRSASGELRLRRTLRLDHEPTNEQMESAAIRHCRRCH
jgi:hypothetical protein